MNKNITVLIYTPAMDENKKDCIASARLLTDNIIFVFPDSSYVETVRELGIKQAKTDWVLILDADERITKELAREVSVIVNGAKNLVKRNFTHYKIPRKNIFGRTWLRHGGWWPDHQIRLINKKVFKGWPKRIHSTPKIEGVAGYLKNPLVHLFHGALSEMVSKTAVFEDIESNLLFRAGRQANVPIFFRKYFAELWRRLIAGLGFLDGPFGIIESLYQAYSKTITQLFLYEKKQKG